MLATTQWNDRPVSAARWLRGLRHRPLVWLAPAIGLGGATGLSAGATLAEGGVVRGDTAFLWPLLPAVGFCFLAWNWRFSAFWGRVALFLAVACLCATHGARRAVPTAGDISFLVPRGAPEGRILPANVTLRGFVAEEPRGGDFKQEFPFEVAAVNGVKTHGFVWISAPPDAKLAVGDEVKIQAGLRDVPRAGNPGQRESAWRFVGNKCWCMAKVRDGEIVVLRHSAKFPLARGIAALRKRLRAHYENAFAGDLQARPYPHATAQLLTAMVFGQGGLDEPLPDETRDAFRASGMLHLLVASGQQVTLLAALVLGGAHALGLRRVWLLLLVAPALFSYALVAGGAASIWRAVIGGLCLAWALLLGRDLDGLSLWSLAFIALFVIEPACLADLSFQLTFAATWGLIALAPSLRRWLGRAFGGGALVEVAAMTMGAQLAVMPLMLFHFGRASWAGFSFNLAAVPLCGVLVATGIAGLFLPISGLVNYPLTRAIGDGATWAASLPGASVETPPLGIMWTLLCAALLLLAAASPLLNDTDSLRQSVLEAWQNWQRRRSWRPQQWLASVLLILALWALRREVALNTAPLRVTMLDVGQGEAIIIRSPAGRTVVIDGGSQDQLGVGRGVLVPYLQSIAAKNLDALVMTHADSDHCNALPALLREIPVGMALDGAMNPRDAQAVDYQLTREALRRFKVPVLPAHAGQRFDLGNGVLLTVLAPLSPQLQSDNDNAAVLRLDYGRTSFLFTADIEAAAEARLVRRGAPLRCTILKVAHHGSATSSTAAFLRAASPRAALISCGRYNPFGHPATSTLQHLARRRVPVFRTDLRGAIEVTSDGNTCSIQTYR